MALQFGASTRFLFLVTGTFASFLAYGYVQELLFATPGLKQYGWFITTFQFSVYAVLSAVEIRIRQIRPTTVSSKMFAIISFFTVATMGLSNTSLAYLSYPAQVVFKSCKLIPVMIGGVLLQRKTYTFVDYLASATLSFGLAVFTLADVTVNPNYNLTGVLLISMALCADAVIGNLQERVMRVDKVPTVQMVHHSYKFGIVYLLGICVVTGELGPALAFCSRHTLSETYLPMLLFSITGYVGVVNFVLALVSEFGALTTVTVTTLRKAVTMVLSFLFFPKPFVFQYVWGGLLVLLGVGLNLYSKQRKKSGTAPFSDVADKGGSLPRYVTASNAGAARTV
eukprot:m.630240 g.630240  ORF g.630240 m.630240 type:complete len:339 (-) comp22565_c2_seq17:2697-3713(-)